MDRQTVKYAFHALLLILAMAAVTQLLRFLPFVILYKWKHNTLLSILCGTVLYMLLVQGVSA